MLAPNDGHFSRVLDVHRWSDHPEIKDLTEKVWLAFSDDERLQLQARANRKPLSDAKKQLRVLLLDLYVAWLDDPFLWVAVARGNGDYTPTSRYNALHISKKIVGVIDALLADGFLDHSPFYHDRRTGGRSSRTSRYKASTKLQAMFRDLTVSLYDVDHHADEEVVVLSDFVTDDQGAFIRSNGGKKKRTFIEYKDEDHPPVVQMRQLLTSYNALLKASYIDVGSLDRPWVERHRKDKTVQTVRIDQTGKWVRRVFSRNSWSHNGRFYGGWWQQIGKDLRADILIDDCETQEVDFKGYHVAILAAEKGILRPLDYDWYDLGELLVPSLTRKEQRAALKLLVLTAVNDKSRKSAYQAFRDNSPISLTDNELSLLLDAFLERNPFLADGICSDRGISLMWKDSQVTELILQDFIERGEIVLSVHDSYIVKRTQVPDLERAMAAATKAIIGASLPADCDDYSPEQRQQILNDFRRHDPSYYYSLQVCGFSKPLPPVSRTERYLESYQKFLKWKGTKEDKSN